MTITRTSTMIDPMGFDERTLLLLGVLMMENQHGYQINDFIENRLCSVISMKKPTAYALLDRLVHQEAVIVHIEQEGSRPPRKVFEITERGRALFLELLHRNLALSPMPQYASDIGLMFVNYLDPADVMTHLEKRLRTLEKQIEEQVEVPSHGPTLSLDLALDHTRVMREAERDWLILTIQKLSR